MARWHASIDPGSEMTSLTASPVFPQTYVDQCLTGGGLFAGQPIAAGIGILRFTGRELTLNDVRARGAAALVLIAHLGASGCFFFVL